MISIDLDFLLQQCKKFIELQILKVLLYKKDLELEIKVLNGNYMKKH